MSVADLERMLNQIALNQSFLPDDEAAAVVATHVVAFWTPGMRRELAAAVDSGTIELNEVARLAAQQLQAA